MKKELFHIYGPFSLQSYGLCIALGLGIMLYFVSRDKKYKELALENVMPDLLSMSILLAILGGRLLFFLAEDHDIDSISRFFSVWEGGFSLLGSVIGLCVGLPVLLRLYKIPLLSFLDLVAPYVPLLQSISRIGCFMAGCCYGKPSLLPWALRYTNPDTIAPIGVYMHPTQLYSAFILFGMFLVSFFYLRPRLKKPGQQISSYLMMISVERFIIDFWRADRVFYTFSSEFYCSVVFQKLLSIYQITAIALFLVGAAMFMYVTRVVYPNHGKHT